MTINILYISVHRLTGTTRQMLNISSYNYLGFAETVGAWADATEEAIYKYGCGIASPSRELGQSNN